MGHASPSRPDSFSAQTALRTAAKTLQLEGESLCRLAQNLPTDFADTIALLLRTRGRVVLSGIGKSGHIARKIAATLASTGTPSYFVHPAEASHGDLGMITQDDVCILISNSGETAELGDLISHARRFAIPLVGISGKIGSTLMAAADFKLLLPAEPEACPIGMAPTTSTTMTLALGDALAMALMEQRGFQKENFRTFHPGGKLGAQLALVHQLMHPLEDTPIVREETAMGDTLIVMTEKGFGIACVTNAEGRLTGVVSDGDLRRNMDTLMQHSATEVATRDPKTVPPDMLAIEAMKEMNAAKVNALIVVDADNRPIGLLRVHDLLRAGVA